MTHQLARGAHAAADSIHTHYSEINFYRDQVPNQLHQLVYDIDERISTHRTLNQLTFQAISGCLSATLQ